jgi:hypothetical protein
MKLSFGRDVPIACTIDYSIGVVRMAVGPFNAYRHSFIIDAAENHVALARG